MFHRGRARKYAALLALLGICASSVGCQAVLLLPEMLFEQPRTETARSPMAPAESPRTVSHDVERTRYLVQAPSPTASQQDITLVQAVEEGKPQAMPSKAPSPMPSKAATPSPKAPAPPSNAEPAGEGDMLPPPRLQESALAEAWPPSAPGAKPSSCTPWGKRCGKNTALGMMQRDVPVSPLPKEGQMQAAPPYVIETPDIMLVEAPRSLPDQPIAGEHLVRMDGTISLGLYGSVRVAGLTIDQARETIEKHLAGFIKEPKVNVDIYAYNSKFFYIIADGAGYGQQVFRLNFTGNDTVLSAISQISGLPATASKKRIWIARPDPANEKNGTVLPVDWIALTQCGVTATNYQLFPSDRLFIQSDRLMAFDSALSKIISPVERLLGVNLLGAFMVLRYQNMGRNVGGGGGGGF